MKSKMESDNAFTRRVLIVLGMATIIVALGMVLVMAIEVVLVIFAGVLLANFLGQLSRRLSARTPLSYRWSLLAIWTVMAIVTAIFLLWMVPRFSDHLATLLERVPQAAQTQWEQLKQQDWARRAIEHLPSSDGFAAHLWKRTPALGGFFSTVTGAVVGVLLVAFCAVYFSWEPEPYRRGFISLFPAARRKRTREILGTVSDTLYWWMLGRLTAMTVIGIGVTVGLWALGVPLPLALGIFAGVVSFVPTIGAVLAVLPALLLALENGPMCAVYVFVFYNVLQLVENYFLTPLVQRQSASIPPVITILSQVFLGVFVGPLGVAVATPLAAAGITGIREAYVKDVLGGPADATPDNDTDE